MAGDYEKTIGFADTAGTRATVSSYLDEDDEGEPTISITVEAGFCAGRGYPTLEAARQFAAAILDAVDHAEQATADG